MKWHVILLTLYLLIPNLASAQDIRRCVKNDGTITFTDRSCAEDEIEKQKPQQNTAGSSNTKRTYSVAPICNRTTEELLYSVRTAIDMQDANLLAKNYHWVNASNQQAENIFTRLETVAAKPLIDIRLLQYSNPPASSDLPVYSPDTDVRAPITSAPKSYALKIVQTNKNTSTLQMSTVFRLQQYFGCYWIRY